LIRFKLLNLISLILVNPGFIFFQLSIEDFHHVSRITILVA